MKHIVLKIAESQRLRFLNNKLTRFVVGVRELEPEFHVEFGAKRSFEVSRPVYNLYKYFTAACTTDILEKPTEKIIDTFIRRNSNGGYSRVVGLHGPRVRHVVPAQTELPLSGNGVRRDAPVRPAPFVPEEQPTRGARVPARQEALLLSGEALQQKILSEMQRREEPPATPSDVWVTENFAAVVSMRDDLKLSWPQILKFATPPGGEVPEGFSTQTLRRAYNKQVSEEAIVANERIGG